MRANMVSFHHTQQYRYTNLLYSMVSFHHKQQYRYTNLLYSMVSFHHTQQDRYNNLLYSMVSFHHTQHDRYANLLYSMVSFHHKQQDRYTNLLYSTQYMVLCLYIYHTFLTNTFYVYGIKQSVCVLFIKDYSLFHMIKAINTQYYIEIFSHSILLMCTEIATLLFNHTHTV